MFKRIILTSFFTVQLLVADEFKSLTELKKQFGENYGPSFESILPVTLGELKLCEIAYFYKTETAIDDKYAKLSVSVAGRRISQIGNELDNMQLKKLVELAGNYANYGDFGPEIKPDIAIEMLFNDVVYVLNYDSKLKMVNYSSNSWELKTGLKKWSKPTKVSPQFAAFIETLKLSKLPHKT